MLPYNNSMLKAPRKAYLRRKNDNITDADVRRKIAELGISKKEFYNILDKELKSRPLLKKELQSFGDPYPEERKQKIQRNVQVSFRIFREGEVRLDDKHRDPNNKKDRKIRFAHEYIEDNGAFYKGDTDLIKIVLPWMYMLNITKIKEKIMLNQVQVRERNAIANEKLMDFVYYLIEGVDMQNGRRIEQILQHYPMKLVIESYEDLSESRNPLPNPSQVRLLDQDTRMSSKFLKYDVNENATSLLDLFKAEKYYRPNSCLANAIMNLVCDKYNNMYVTKPRCTYEFLWKLAFPNKSYESEFPLSFDEAIPIFKYFRIRAEQRQINGAIEAKYHPQDDDLKVDTRYGGRNGLNLVYIRKDNHAFAINDSDMKTSLTLKVLKVNEDEIKCSTKFPIPSGKSLLVGGVSTIEELVSKVVEYRNRNRNLESKFIKVLWCSEVPLCDILRFMVIDCRYHPGITISSGFTINSLTFSVGDTFINLCRANYGEETPITKDLTSLNVEECLRYQHLKNETMLKMLKPYYKSQYGDGVLNMLKEHNRSAIQGTFKFVQTYRKKYVGLDSIKCYPSILRDIKNIPVFTKFDKFVNYSNEKIDDYSLYYVKRTASETKSMQVLMNNKYDVIYGMTLKLIKKNVRILAVCTPAKIYPNTYKEVIDDVLIDDLLSENVKKQILVSSIGYFGKFHGFASKQRIYTTHDDARRDQEKNGGIISYVGVDKGYEDKDGIIHYKNKIYVVKQTKNVELEDGFLPIQHLIYDLCRIKLSDTIKMVEMQGCTPLGVKTDSVFISEEDAKKILLPWKHEIDGCDLKNIGSLKKEYGTMPSQILKGKTQSCGSLFIHKKSKVITYTLEDEYSMKEFYDIFRTYNHLMIKAKHAGSGKSYACKKYIKDKDHAIACPQNAQARKLQLEGYNAMTLYQLCSSRPTDDVHVVQVCGMLEFDYVILEEVGQYTIKEWDMIRRYMKTFPETRIIANGDELQNDPIEHNFNANLVVEKYYTSIIDSIFPHQIMLEIPKRYKEDQIDRVKQLRYDLFIKKLPINEIFKKYAKTIRSMKDIPLDCAFITYLQETRSEMNEWEHKRRGYNCIYEGLVVRANQHIKIYSIMKHFDYKIVRIDDDRVILLDETSDKEIEIPKVMMQYFSYPYAFTGHSLQGDTIDKRIVIFDSDFHHVTRKWIYVALTRSSDLDNVFVFEGKKILTIPESDIDNKIIGYMRQDGKRIVSSKTNEVKRNYIDVSWVLKQSKLQMHKCSCCCEVMNLVNDGSMLDWTVDRVDSKKMHTKDNCVLMCWNCNITKKDNIIV